MSETLERVVGRSASAVVEPERRPFVRLIAAPDGSVDPSVRRGAAFARHLLEPAVPALVRDLVAFSLRAGRPVGTGPSASPSVSVLNRRRRAAGLWWQAILAADLEPRTLHAVAHSWLPQLAGTGPDVSRCVATGRDCVEYVRGQVAAGIMDAPAENLVPRALALHGIDTVLAVHLRALQATGG